MVASAPWAWKRSAAVATAAPSRTNKLRLFYLLLILLGWIFLNPPQPYFPRAATALDCVSRGHLLDFPQKNEPAGQRFKLKLLDSNCLASGSEIMASDYHRHPYELGRIYRFRLKFSANSRWGRVQSVAEVTEASGPWLLQLRQWVANRIAANFQNNNQRWLRALLLGDRSRLSHWDNQALRNTGTAHLIAISGSHLVIFATMTYLLMLLPAVFLKKRFGLWPEPRTLALLFSTLICGVYSLLTGLEAPVLRAWLLMFFLLGHWLNPIIARGGQALTLAAITQLLLFPEDLFSAAAWLSYTAVLAIMVIWPWLKNIGPINQYLLLQAFISLAMAPLLWALFGTINPLAIPVNLVLVLWTPLLLYGAIWGVFFKFIAHLTDFFASYYFGFIEFWGTKIHPVEPRFQPSLASGAAVSLLIILLFSSFPQKKRFALLLLAIALIGAWQPTRELWSRPGKLPSALVQHEGAYYLINVTADFSRHHLPELRRRAARPRALILTSAKAGAQAELGRLMAFYPEIAIYSLMPQADNFVYPVAVCPARAGSLQFTKTAAGCQLAIGPWRISEQELIRKNNLD